MADNQIAQLQLRDVLNVIFKRKNQIILTFGTVMIAVAAYTFLTQPLYESSAQVLVTFGRGSVLFTNTGEQAPNIFIDQENVMNSEIEILRSNQLAEKTIKGLGGVKEVFPDISKKAADYPDPDRVAMHNALEKFQKSFTIKPGKKSNLITIAFRHPDPKMAAEIVKRLSANFLDHHAEIRKNKKSYEFFQNQTKILEAKLNASQKELESLRSTYQISNFEEQKSILLRQKAELQSILNQAASAETEASNRIAELRRKIQSTPESIPQQRQDDPNDVLISTLQSRLVELELQEKSLELELQEKSLSSKFTDENRSLRSTRDEIAILRQKLSEQENKTYGRRTSGMNPVHQLIQQELVRYEMERKAFGAKKEILTKQVSDCDTKLSDLNHIELQFNQLNQQVQTDRKNFELYLTKLEEARISDAMDTEKISNLSLVETASVPLKPASPKVALNLIIGVFIGLFAAFTMALVQEYMNDRLESPEDVGRVLKLPVLTSIAEVRKAS